jgi:hypothetical protein
MSPETVIRPAHRYRVLELVASVHILIGAVALVFGIGIAVYSVTSDTGTASFAGMTLVAGILLFAFGQLLQVAVHVAESVSVIEQALLLAREPEASQNESENPARP